MLKKILSLMMVLAMVCAIVPLAVTAAEYETTIDFNSLADGAIDYGSSETSANFPPAFVRSKKNIVTITDDDLDGNTSKYAKLHINTTSVPSNWYPYNSAGRHLLLRVDDGGAAVTTGSYAFQAKFATDTHMEHMHILFAPWFVSNTKQPDDNATTAPFVYAYKGDLYVSSNSRIDPTTNTKLSGTTYALEKWFTLGGVVTLGDGTAAYDVYFNGNKVHTATYASSSLYYFALQASTNPNGSGNPNILIDDIYLGRDTGKVAGYPTVTSISPTAGATNVETDSSIVLNFSKPISRTSFESSLSITPTTAFTVEWSNDDKTATVVPDTPLTTNTSYTVSLPTTLEAADGAKLQAAYSSSFTTAGTAAEVFTMTDHTPAEGATSVSSSLDSLTFTFNREANTETFAQNLTIEPNVYIGRPVWSDANKTVTVPIKGQLRGFSKYTVTIGTGFVNTTGKSLNGVRAFSFSTGAGKMHFFQDFEGVASGTIYDRTQSPHPNAGILQNANINFTVINNLDYVTRGNVIYYVFEKRGSGTETNQSEAFYLAPARATAIDGSGIQTYAFESQADKTFYMGYKFKIADNPTPTNDYFKAISEISTQFFHDAESGSGGNGGIKWTRNSDSDPTGGVVSFGDWSANVPYSDWMDVGYEITSSSTNGTSYKVYFNGTLIGTGYSEKTTPIASLKVTVSRDRVSLPNATETSRTPNLFLDDIYSSEENPYAPDLSLATGATASVEEDGALVLDFTAPVKDTLLESAITVTKSGGSVVAVHDALLSNESKTLKLYLDELSPNETYTVTIDPYILESIDGKPLTGNNVVAFTTGADTFLFNVDFYADNDSEKTSTPIAVDGDITVEGTVTITESKGPVEVIIARYSDNRLEDVQKPTLTAGDNNQKTFSVVLSGCASTDTIKVFAWNSLEGMKPFGSRKMLPPQ